jgi:hypothetical protein
MLFYAYSGVSQEPAVLYDQKGDRPLERGYEGSLKTAEYSLFLENNVNTGIFTKRPDKEP